MEKLSKEVLAWLKKNRHRFKEIAYLSGVTERTLQNIMEDTAGKRHRTVVKAITAVYESQL